MTAFSIGAASSFAAGVVILVLTHLEDLHYLLTSSSRYRHLEGAWYQYHLTRDSRHASDVFWSAHIETLRVTRFGRVRGVSQGRHTPKLCYQVAGHIRNNVMQLRFKNRSAHELLVNITYPCLLSEEILVGVWVGHDYDEHMRDGPIVLSRRERTASELEEITRDGRQLTVPRRGRRPAVAGSTSGSSRSLDGGWRAGSPARLSRSSASSRVRSCAA